MSRRALIAGSLCLAVLLGGCSLGKKTASTGSFTGTKANIAVTLNALASDSKSGDETGICTSVLDSAVVARLRRVGTCTQIIKDQLKTVDNFTLTIKSIAVTGARATARVQTKHNGQLKTQTVVLRREQGGWRIDSLI